MKDWTALDWFVIVTPFVVIGGMGWWTVHHQRRCLVCHKHHKNVALRRRHELIHGMH